MSEVDDSPYQWKHYTDCIRGGYQIAFSRSKLEAAIDSVNEANTQSKIKANQKQILLLLPCFYIGVDDVAIQQIFSAIMDDFRAEFEDVKNGNLSNKRSGRRVLASIFLCSAIIKRNCFRHEHEWRIIVIATPEISSQFETTVGKPCLRTFLSSSISGGGIKDLIAEVKCSPQGNIAELTRKANCVLQSAESQLVLHTSTLPLPIVDNYITRINCLPAYEEYVIEKTLTGNAREPLKSQETFIMDSENTANIAPDRDL